MHENLVRCLCSAEALRVLEIPAALAKSKVLEKGFGAPRAGRWIKLRRLIINGPLEVIDRNHMGMLFFKLLSPPEDAQLEPQLRELEMNFRWAEVRRNIPRVNNHGNGQVVDRPLIIYHTRAGVGQDVDERHYEWGGTSPAPDEEEASEEPSEERRAGLDEEQRSHAELAVQEVFSRVFPRLEKLTLQCAGRDLFEQDWFVALFSNLQMQSLRFLSLGLPRRYSPQMFSDAHGPRRRRSGGWGHVVKFLSAYLPPWLRTLELKNMDWSDLDTTTVLLPFLRSLKVKVLRLEDISFSATQSGALLGFLEFAPDLSLATQCRAHLLRQVRAATAEAGEGAVKISVKPCREE